MLIDNNPAAFLLRNFEYDFLYINLHGYITFYELSVNSAAFPRNQLTYKLLNNSLLSNSILLQAISKISGIPLALLIIGNDKDQFKNMFGKGINMTTTTYSISTLSFWKAYWITMRPYLLFVSGAAGMAGFAAGPETNWAVAAGVFLVLFLSYGFGQALTDCFQTDTDSISSPYRPLVRGIISREQVLLVSLSGLTAGCLILLFLNVWIAIPGLLCIFGLATYTYFKRRWWGGPFYNAWIVALLPVIGYLAARETNGSFSAILGNEILLGIIISVFFSYANFVLMGYFKDISADRASGYNTFVVVFGWKKAATVSDIFALISIFATGWIMLHRFLNRMLPSLGWLAILLFFAAAAVLIFAQVEIHRTRDEKEAFHPIANVVRGFVLLRLSEICLLKPGWLIAAFIFYLGFELTLKARPEKAQV